MASGPYDNPARVLLYLQSHHGALSATIAKKFALDRSIVRNCLELLESIGKVRRDRDGDRVRWYVASAMTPTEAQEYLVAAAATETGRAILTDLGWVGIIEAPCSGDKRSTVRAAEVLRQEMQKRYGL